MLNAKSTKRRIIRVVLGLLISVSMMTPAAFARGGGGGGGGGGGHSGGGSASFSGGGGDRGGSSGGGSHFSGGNSGFSGGGDRGGSGFSRGSSSSRSESMGNEMRSSSGFSRADNFSSGRMSNAPAFSSDRPAARFNDSGERFNSGRSMSADRFGGRDASVAPRQFGETHQFNNMRGTGEAPRVSREAIAPPLSQSLRNPRSGQISQSMSAETSRSSVLSREGTFRDSSARFAGERRDRQMGGVNATAGRQVASATTDRTRIMSPLGAATTRNSFHGGNNAFHSGNNAFHSGNNHAVASNFSGSHSSGSWGHQSSAWHGNWHQGNAWHGNSWRWNNWHGNHHHGHFHNDNVFFVFGGFWPWPWWWWGGWYPYYWYPYYYGYPYYGYDGSIGYGNTYNYNYNDGTSGVLQPGSTAYGMQVPDYNALSAVGQKTTPETKSDKLFDEGVTAFGNQDYATAISKLQQAVRLEPDDTVLPFAYAQALFANNDYEQAAAVITTTISEMYPHKAEISYPRGLYKDENVLNAQIKNLERAVLMDPTNTQLQLLYGYQLLGIGKIDEAKVALTVAKRDARTTAPATALLDLLERTKQPSTTSGNN